MSHVSRVPQYTTRVGHTENLPSSLTVDKILQFQLTSVGLYKFDGQNGKWGHENSFSFKVMFINYIALAIEYKHIQIIVWFYWYQYYLSSL